MPDGAVLNVDYTRANNVPPPAMNRFKDSVKRSLNSQLNANTPPEKLIAWYLAEDGYMSGSGNRDTYNVITTDGKEKETTARKDHHYAFYAINGKTRDREAWAAGAVLAGGKGLRAAAGAAGCYDLQS